MIRGINKMLVHKIAEEILSVLYIKLYILISKIGNKINRTLL